MKPVRDITVTQHTITLCQKGLELFDAFWRLRESNQPCDNEYRLLDKHRGFCRECRQEEV